MDINEVKLIIGQIELAQKEHINGLDKLTDAAHNELDSSSEIFIRIIQSQFSAAEIHTTIAALKKALST